MDGVNVKAMVDKRAEAEVYPLLLVCQDTGAVHPEVAYGYSTGALLVQWDCFVVKRGRPSEVVSDRGSQLTSTDDTDLLNWDQVQGGEAERGMAWKFFPPGHQWRKKLVESRVKAFKLTLKQMLSKTLSGGKPTLRYEKLCTVLTMTVNVVNDQPIALKSPIARTLCPSP